MKKKAIIISLSSFSLSSNEKKLLSNENPWGIILFKRNIKNFLQLKNLIASIKRICKDKNFPILIDEEGGAVSRIENIFDNSPYSQSFFGEMYLIDKQLSISLYKNYLNSMCSFFKKVGININTVPVLDI